LQKGVCGVTKVRVYPGGGGCQSASRGLVLPQGMGAVEMLPVNRRIFNLPFPFLYVTVSN